MRIIITQEEIEEAIEKLILDQVDVPDDMRIDIDLKATRGDQGYTAEIDIVAHDAPTDGTDRSVDPRIEVVEGAETLGIAEKVMEAKSEAARPRRRGRPAGAKNKPKTHRVDPDLPEQASVGTTEAPQETAQEAQESVEQAEVVETTELVGDAPDEAPVAAEQDTQTEAVEEPVAEEEDVDYTPTPETPGLETVEQDVEHNEQHVSGNAGTMIDATDATTDTVNETVSTEDMPQNSGVQHPDVSSQVQTEELAETVQESIETKEPEPAPETAAPPSTPPRSLFANLQRPVNKPING